MTCVVGLRTEAGVCIGADSGGFSGWDHTSRRDPKVFHNASYLIGGSTSYRMLQILRYAALPQVPDEAAEVARVGGDALHRFMCTKFVDAVRSALRDGGWLQKDKEREDGGNFIVGVAGRMYDIGPDMQVGESHDDFAAVGCGSQFALGSLAASSSLPLMMPEAHVRLALSVAERFSGGVRGPFVVLHQSVGAA